MNQIKLRKKYYNGLQIQAVVNEFELEFEAALELYKKFAQLETDDVVEVIRCRECKHFEHGLYCAKWLRDFTDEDGFCHKAEREYE